MLYVDPELDDTLGRGRGASTPFVLGDDDERLLRFDGSSRAPWEPDEDATATINYTSGTTARPKGVQLTHRNIWVNAVTFALHAGVTDRDVYLHTLPMFHANGWGMPFAMTGAGRAAGRAAQGRRRRDPAPGRAARRHADVRARRRSSTSVLEAAADVGRARSPAATGCGSSCAGAPPPTRTIARVEEELGWEFIQIYGLTETSPLLTINRTPAGVGRPARRGARAAKLSRAGAPALGVTVQGLRLGRGAGPLQRGARRLLGAARGDRGRARRTAGSTPATAASIDDDGYLTISDRKKDVIITGGENVSSIEVEDAIFTHPAVAEVAVIGVPDEKWGETIKALVVLAEGAERDRGGAHRALQGAARRATRRRRRWSSATSSPRTATGKLQKFKLREPYWEGRDRQVN